MSIKIVGYISSSGKMHPVMTDEEESRLLESMPWLTEDDFEEVPPSKLVIEVESRNQEEAVLRY